MQPEETVTHSPSGLRESATPADWRLVAVCLAVVALSAFYISLNYRAAFPQASLRLELSRDAITDRAERFLAARGHRLDSYRNITLFDADDDARLFLEREAGLVEANRLMESDVPVWRWRARWYKPPQKEEFQVWLSPAGRLVGFDHVMAEDAPGERLEVGAARVLAEAFLREQASWRAEPVEAQSEDRPNRRDHSFTFERAGFAAKDGRVRASVVVRGGRVEAYREFLKVPEQWQRDFAALRSKNQLYSQIAQAFFVALMLAAAVTLIGGLRRGDIIWRPAALFSGVVAILSILAAWNNLPFGLNSLPSSTPIGEAILLILLQSAGAGAGAFIYVIFAAAPGLVAYRDLLPEKLNLKAAFSSRALDTREFFRAAVSGLGLAAFHLAFVTAFYLIGQRFGVWAPQDVEQSDLLSTVAPWVYPLTMSLLAASSEEFWFRLLAVPLVKRWTGSTWIAILLPAFVWGFLHANYPQQPGYIRGVEVGLIGVAAGWVMLRFGILATLIWHYTVDAILFSTYLLAADSWPLRLSGLAVSGLALIPLGWCAWRYRRNGGFVVDASMTNAALKRGTAPLATHALPEPEPATSPMISPVGLYGLAGLAVLGAFFYSVPLAGDFVRVGVTRESAAAAAGKHGSGELAAVEFTANLDGETFEYLRQHVGREKADRILQERTVTGVWRVRHFAPGRKNEVWSYVDGAGKAFRQDLVLDEKAAGAMLPEAEARQVAEKHVADAQGINLAGYKLVDSSSEKRVARTDHNFVWEDDSFRVGEAKARISVEILGSQPSRFRRYLKLPEEWQREYRKPRMRSLPLPAAAGGFAFLAIGVFLSLLRRAPFRPGRYWPVAVVAALLMLAAEANQWPQFYLPYSTDQPLADFHADFLLSMAMRVLLAGAGVFLTAYMLDVFLHLRQGDRRLAPFSLAGVLSLAALSGGVVQIFNAVEAKIPGERLSTALWSPPPVDTWSPGLAVLLNAGLAAVVGAVIVALTIAVVLSVERRAAYATILATCWALAHGGSVPLFAFHFITVLVLLWLMRYVALATGAAVSTLSGAIFLAIAARGAVALWQQPGGHYHMAAFAVASGVIVVLGAAAAVSARGGYEPAGSSASTSQ